MIGGTGFKNSLVAALDLISLTFDDSEIVSRSDICTLIVDDATSVDVDTCDSLSTGLVEELSLERVSPMVRDVVV